VLTISKPNKSWDIQKLITIFLIEKLIRNGGRLFIFWKWNIVLTY
jgi:hypothetical protein